MKLYNTAIIILLIILSQNYASAQLTYSWSDEWSTSGNISGWKFKSNDIYFAGDFIAINENLLHSVHPSDYASEFVYGWSNGVGYTFASEWGNKGNGKLGSSGWNIGSADSYIKLKSDALTGDYLLATNWQSKWAMVLTEWSGFGGWTDIWDNGTNLGKIIGWNLSSSDQFISGNFDSSTPGDELFLCNSNGFAALLHFGNNNGYQWMPVWGNGGNGWVGAMSISSNNQYIAGDFDNDGTDELLCLNYASGSAMLLKYSSSGWTTLWTNNGIGWIGPGGAAGWHIQYSDGYTAGAFFPSTGSQLFLKNVAGWAMIEQYTGSGWVALWSNSGNGKINGWNLSGNDRVLISKLNNTTQTPGAENCARLLLINPSGTGYALMTRFAATPTAPTGLIVVATTQTQITLSWNAVSGATAYTVYQDGSAISGSISTNSYTAAVSCGITHSYYVIAGNAGSWSGASNTVPGTASACTFAISGSVGNPGGGIIGVVMNGLPGNPSTTSPNGQYTASVPYGWSGTVTPTKAGYTFSPPSQAYSNVTSNHVNIYTGTALHKIGAEGYGGLPQEFALLQNVPNPFNPTTVVSYQLSATSRVSLKIYDLLGREVVTLVDDIKEAGYYNATFNASHLSSGMFFARLVAQSDNGRPFVQTIKLLLTK